VGFGPHVELSKGAIIYHVEAWVVSKERRMHNLSKWGIVVFYDLVILSEKIARWNRKTKEMQLWE
jgi:hypothetical protein